MTNILNRSYKKLDLSYGSFTIYPRFVLGEWTLPEVTPDHVHELRVLVENEFGDNPYGYIGNRVHSHSVDAAGVGSVLSEVTNLKAIAIVAYHLQGRLIANLEKQFYQSHELQVFSDVDSAIKWMNDKMEKYYI